MIKDFMMVACGGALGAIMRYSMSYFFTSAGSNWPWGTLIVNLLGSLFAGILIALSMSRIQMSEAMNLLWMIGFLGAFTTYSAFSAELLQYLLEQHYLAFVFHFCSNTFGAIVFVLLGYFLSMKAIG